MNNQRDWAGLIGGAVLIFSLFLPWITTGIFSRKGIDNPDGLVLLLFGGIAILYAIFNISNKKPSKTGLLYPILGLLSGAVLYMDYSEVQERVRSLASSLNSLSSITGGSTIEAYNFIGMGLYVGIFASLILIISLFLKSE